MQHTPGRRHVIVMTLRWRQSGVVYDACYRTVACRESPPHSGAA